MLKRIDHVNDFSDPFSLIAARIMELFDYGCDNCLQWAKCIFFGTVLLSSEGVDSPCNRWLSETMISQRGVNPKLITNISLSITMTLSKLYGQVYCGVHQSSVGYTVARTTPCYLLRCFISSSIISRELEWYFPGCTTWCVPLHTRFCISYLALRCMVWACCACIASVHWSTVYSTLSDCLTASS